MPLVPCNGPESFEDKMVAEFMNKTFVSLKVDREVSGYFSILY